MSRLFTFFCLGLAIGGLAMLKFRVELPSEQDATAVRQLGKKLRAVKKAVAPVYENTILNDDLYEPVVPTEERIAGTKSKGIIAVCACTHSLPSWTSVKATSLVKLLLPSIARTISSKELDKYSVKLYLGADHDDMFWLNNWQSLSNYTDVPIIFKFYKVDKHKIPFNKLMLDAYNDGVEYFTRINDDTEFVTSNWITQAVDKLLSYSPPNVGMVGPICKTGNTAIMTHDFVHRTHMDIFKKQYYPDVFSAWWVDDWISLVYGKDRSTKLSTWEVKHHTHKHGTRYEVQHDEKNFLSGELNKGKVMIESYLNDVGSRVCVWNGGVESTECSTLFKGGKKGVEIAKVTYFGDSTMSRIFHSISSKNKCVCGSVISSGRCNLVENLGLQRVSKWIKPNSNEGPLAYGKTHPFCTDCSGCSSNICVSAARGNCIEESYFSIEFARDVEMQTVGGGTTQETVITYLKGKPMSDICIVSAGLHDMAIPNLSDASYEENLKWYLHLLQQVCKKLIFVGMSSVLGNPSYKQTNSRIKIWNKISSDIIKSIDLAVYINIFEASSNGKHVDNTHMAGSFYKNLKLFLTNLFGAKNADISIGTNLVKNNVPVFEQIVLDSKKGDKKFLPTVYWARYFPKTASYIRNNDIGDLRRSTQGALSSFGASLHSWEGLTDKCVEEANKGGVQLNTTPLLSLSASNLGLPPSIVINKKSYNGHFVNAYERYLLLLRSGIDLNSVTTYVEIGSGIGNQVELFKKLFPHWRFYLFDLAPQLYIAHQWLSGVFPKDVIPYGESRLLKGPLSIPNGKIALFPTNMLDVWKAPGGTLFWNAASFEEMPRETVHMYSNIISNAGTDYVFNTEWCRQPSNLDNTGHTKGMEFPEYRKMWQNLGFTELIYKDSVMHGCKRAKWLCAAVWQKKGLKVSLPVSLREKKVVVLGKGESAIFLNNSNKNVIVTSNHGLGLTNVSDFHFGLDWNFGDLPSTFFCRAKVLVIPTYFHDCRTGICKFVSSALWLKHLHFSGPIFLVQLPDGPIHADIDIWTGKEMLHSSGDLSFAWMLKHSVYNTYESFGIGGSGYAPVKFSNRYKKSLNSKFLQNTKVHTNHIKDRFALFKSKRWIQKLKITITKDTSIIPTQCEKDKSVSWWSNDPNREYGPSVEEAISASNDKIGVFGTSSVKTIKAQLPPLKTVHILTKNDNLVNFQACTGNKFDCLIVSIGYDTLNSSISHSDIHFEFSEVSESWNVDNYKKATVTVVSIVGKRTLSLPSSVLKMHTFKPSLSNYKNAKAWLYARGYRNFYETYRLKGSPFNQKKTKVMDTGFDCIRTKPISQMCEKIIRVTKLSTEREQLDSKIDWKSLWSMKTFQNPKSFTETFDTCTVLGSSTLTGRDVYNYSDHFLGSDVVFAVNSKRPFQDIPTQVRVIETFDYHHGLEEDMKAVAKKANLITSWSDITNFKPPGGARVALPSGEAVLKKISKLLGIKNPGFTSGSFMVLWAKQYCKKVKVIGFYGFSKFPNWYLGNAGYSGSYSLNTEKTGQFLAMMMYLRLHELNQIEFIL